MTEQSIIQVIEALSIKLGLTANEIIPHFTKYYYVSAWIWCGAAIFGMIMAVIFIIYCFRPKNQDEAKWMTAGIVILLIALFLGGITIATNATDIFVPQASAIEKLITSIRGSN